MDRLAANITYLCGGYQNEVLWRLESLPQLINFKTVWFVVAIHPNLVVSNNCLQVGKFLALYYDNRTKENITYQLDNESRR